MLHKCLAGRGQTSQARRALAVLAMAQNQRGGMHQSLLRRIWTWHASEHERLHLCCESGVGSIVLPHLTFPVGLHCCLIRNIYIYIYIYANGTCSATSGMFRYQCANTCLQTSLAMTATWVIVHLEPMHFCLHLLACVSQGAGNTQLENHHSFVRCSYCRRPTP